MSVSDLRALWPGDLPPVLLYMHENQLSYPVPEGERMDLHFGFTDITSALAADAVVFNSRFHRETFFAELPQFLRRLPEYRPTWVVDEIEGKSRVLYPGCRFPGLGAGAGLLGGEAAEGRGAAVRPSAGFRNDRPRILWNHRWEFDKRPEAFFAALRTARSRGAEFDLVIVGENFQAEPQSFLKARDEFGSSILQFGYVESREEYHRWVESCDVVVSTAEQENFGISVMEAMRYGCFPLLPRRLAYPELVPRELHSAVLYDTDEELADRLSELLLGRVGAAELLRTREAVRSVADRFAWEHRIGEFDRLIAEVGRRDSEKST
jgi:glycosyltransferase involved in cell wall biosynthesis